MNKDHPGNEFDTLKEMYRHYGVAVSMFRNRRNKDLEFGEIVMQ